MISDDSHRQAELSGHDSEDYFRLLFMNAPMPYQSLDEQGNFLEVNQTLIDALGYTREELIGRNFGEILHPDWTAHFKENFPRFKAIGEILGVEFEIIKKDGSSILVFFNGKIQRDAQGHFQRTHCIFQDITASRRAEQERRDIGARYAALFNYMNIGVATYQAVDDGHDFVFTDINPAAKKISKLKKEDVIGRRLRQVLPGMDQTGLMEALRQVWLSGEPINVPAFFYRDTRREGWRRNYLAKLPSGEIISIYEDITEIIEAEAQLKQSHSLLEGILNGIDDIVSIKNPDYTLIRYNQAGYTVLGLTPEEVAGKPCYELVGRTAPCDECATALVLKSRKPETIEKFEPRFKRHFFTRSNPILNENGDVVYIVEHLHDVTERRQREARLRQLEKSEGLARMAGAVAHQYNNLMAIVMGNLEMAGIDCAPGSNLEESISEALRATRRAAELGGAMLAYLGQTVAPRTPLDLSDICRQAMPALGLDAHANLTVDAVWPLPGLIVRTSASQIQQILKNLCDNAREALGEEACRISLRLKRVAAADIPANGRFPVNFQPETDAYACLEVADTGCGMAPAERDKLFDPFYSTKFPGRGLGLPVVLGNVKAHNGCITVTSTPGQGSCFQVYLPMSSEVAECLEKSSGLVASPIRKVGPVAPAETDSTILLVEDEPSVCRMTTALLEKLGLTVVAARDGVEAVALFRQHHLEIGGVLCDLSMPRMNGWETLEALRKLDPQIPVILASGYDQAHVMAGARHERPQALLSKPYGMAELKAALVKAMGTRMLLELKI